MGRPEADRWEHQARAWADFTRGPERDPYADYSERFFSLLPAPEGEMLEVGCGEGRVCRDLRAIGYQPTGVDGSPTLVELAAAADPAGRYVVADAAALPFPDGTFRVVVAYNVLMYLDDLDGAMRETARVLGPGGVFAACVPHPFADAGTFAERRADAPFVVAGSYLGRREFRATGQRNGAVVEFVGWANDLQTYVGSLSRAGLLIDALVEPPATEAMVRRDPSQARWARLPSYLFIRAVKPR
jgi:SAM-dependent methyltransferase